MSLPVRVPGFSVTSQFVELEYEVLVFTSYKALKNPNYPEMGRLYYDAVENDDWDFLDACENVVSRVLFSGKPVNLTVITGEYDEEIEEALSEHEYRLGEKPKVIRRGRLYDVQY